MPWDKLPYLCVLAVLVAASFGMPIPEDIPLLTGGWLCYRGLAVLPIMIAVGMLGVLTGDVCLFFMGRRFGHHIVEHRFMRRIVKPSRLLLAEHLFEHHGIKIIFAARFLPGLRAMVFLASGVMKVPFWKFISVNGSAACISVPTLVVLGWLFGSQFDQLKSDVRMVTNIIGFLGLIVLVVAVGLYFHRRSKQYLAEAGPDEAVDADTLVQLPPGGHVEHTSAVGKPAAPMSASTVSEQVSSSHNDSSAAQVAGGV
ncbi:MAG TPA: DedA family protein [Phycisphaerae bacterium]|nr:DedA family protein [Phycisphaerae bacterium]HRR85147.1 DedA family protein [Phycisphaerae bacterium]